MESCNLVILVKGSDTFFDVEAMHSGCRSEAPHLFLSCYARDAIVQRTSWKKGVTLERHTILTATTRWMPLMYARILRQAVKKV